jgi:hypothetical protein
VLQDRDLWELERIIYLGTNCLQQLQSNGYFSKIYEAGGINIIEKNRATMIQITACYIDEIIGKCRNGIRNT